jgi:hypothetical protein
VENETKKEKRHMNMKEKRRTTVRSESRCALGLRYVELVVSIEVSVEVCC